jgi:cysteine desulfurase
LAATAGLVVALEQFVKNPVFPKPLLWPLTEKLRNAANSWQRVHFRGSPVYRLANTVSFTVEGTDSIALLAALDLEGICASSGSACSAGSLTPSHVVKAMGVTEAEANALLRFSLGRESTMEEVGVLVAAMPAILCRLRE